MVNPDIWWKIGYYAGKTLKDYGASALSGGAIATGYKYLNNWLSTQTQTENPGNISARNNLILYKRMNGRRYYYKRYWRQNYWAKRKYAIRRSLKAKSNGMYYKADQTIIIRYTVGSATGTKQIVKEYIDYAGGPTTSVNTMIGLRDLMPQKAYDMSKIYNLGRIRGIALEWTPNITGLTSSSSFPLLACYLDYPKQQLGTLETNYIHALDRESSCILGCLKTTKYVRSFIKYNDMTDFFNELQQGTLRFADDLEHADMPNGAVLGTLKVRYYIQYKGNKL